MFEFKQKSIFPSSALSIPTHRAPRFVLSTGDEGLALAWLLAQKPWTVPIPGTTKLHRLEENFGAVGVELSENDLTRINAAAAQLSVEGDRLPEGAPKDDWPVGALLSLALRELWQRFFVQRNGSALVPRSRPV